MGIRNKPAAPASPWQNGFAERLIGSIRRECVDHIIVLGEMHLRRILKSYADYYNSVRTHRSLNKDAPVTRPVQRTGMISSRAILADFITTTTTPELKLSVHTTSPSRRSSLIAREFKRTKTQISVKAVSHGSQRGLGIAILIQFNQNLYDVFSERLHRLQRRHFPSCPP
jgi:Integrase core domain